MRLSPSHLKRDCAFRWGRRLISRYHAPMDYHYPISAELEALSGDDPNALMRAWGGDPSRARDVFHGGQTLAMAAAQQGAHRCLDLLLLHGADIDALDEDEWSLSFMAVNYDQAQCLRVLLAHGAAVDTPCPGGAPTLAGEAARRGFVEPLRLLIDAGANISIRDRWGNWPLAIAALAGRLGCVQLLVERDPDWLPKVEASIALAQSRGHGDCASFLISARDRAALDANTPAGAPKTSAPRV